MPEVIEAKEVAVLPELSIQIIGQVKGSNLVEYKKTAIAFIESINTDLKTDEDFSLADKAIKFCSKIESDLDTVKEKALSKTADINLLFKSLDELKEATRNKRLKLSKLAKDQKLVVRTSILTEAIKALNDHVAVIYEDIKPLSFPHLGADFQKAMKGKSAVKSMKESVNKELKAAIDKADEYQKHINFNLTTMNELASDFKFLFNDLQAIILNEHDHFELITTTRVNDYKEAEIKRIAKIEADAEVAAKEKLEDAEAQKLIDDAKAGEELPAEPETKSVVQAEDSKRVETRRSVNKLMHKTEQETNPSVDLKKEAKQKAVKALCDWGVNVNTATNVIDIISKGVITGVVINY